MYGRSKDGACRVPHRWLPPKVVRTVRRNPPELSRTQDVAIYVDTRVIRLEDLDEPLLHERRVRGTRIARTTATGSVLNARLTSGARGGTLERARPVRHHAQNLTFQLLRFVFDHEEALTVSADVVVGGGRTRHAARRSDSRQILAFPECRFDDEVKVRPMVSP